MEAKKLSKRLGEILVERGKLGIADLERALRLQESSRSERIGVVIASAGFASERDVTEALAEQLQLPVVATVRLPRIARS